MKLFILECRKGALVWYLTPDQNTTMKPKWALKFTTKAEADAYLSEFRSLWMYSAVEHQFEESELEKDLQPREANL